ncbi:hypothetical protein [Paenibacillus rigui]|uniref:Uncharacterized protein n=1 Tax=Paenibacillus rigui TaxID=554312 RepID=A0A229UH16_9BACL|nr:hypothetical protein [Paenibacillus rigui]OXM82645.1 hypothetical protein CF651_29950 [Paenibacillus rigui]
MNRKFSKTIALFLLIGSMSLSTQALGAEKTALKPGALKYEMQDIKVQYAAEFTAYPKSTAKKSEAGASVNTAVYGGTNPGPIKVLYGVVKLTNPGGSSFTEEFIRVSDGTHSVRALSNGGGPIYGNGSQVRGRKTEFVTGKKIEGSAVIKDYSEGWKTIQLTRNWDEYGNPMSMSIGFQWNLKGTADPYFQQLTETKYEIDLTTLKFTGTNQAVGK